MDVSGTLQLVSALTGLAVAIRLLIVAVAESHQERPARHLPQPDTPSPVTFPEITPGDGRK